MYNKNKEKIYDEILKIFNDFEGRYLGTQKRAFGNGDVIINDQQISQSQVKNEEDEERDKEIYEEDAVKKMEKEEKDEDEKESDEDVFDSLFSKLTDESDDEEKEDEDEQKYEQYETTSYSSNQNTNNEEKISSYLTRSLVRTFSQKISSIYQEKIWEIYKLISKED